MSTTNFSQDPKGMKKTAKRKRQKRFIEYKEFWFDTAAADRAENFFPRYLKHTKGKYAGLPFELAKWESRDIIRPLFGWKRQDGTRRYRTVYVEVPKKNGKSTIAAGVALYLLTGDQEPGAEIYSAAGDKDQAAIVFDLAVQMREASEQMSKRTIKYRTSIVNPALNAFYRVLSSDVATKHGLNPHGIIFDEVHVQPNRDLWDTLTTGVAARTQPVTLAMTTAGYDRTSLCYELHDYAKRVKKGTVKDDEFLGVIYAAEEHDDWTDPKIWKKANPNLGISVSSDYIKRACARAQELPAFENTFRRLHLNQWTQQSERWLQMSLWDASAGIVDPGDLEGRPCYGGLDLSSTTDLAALLLTFEIEGIGDETSIYKWLPFFWIPEDKVREKIRTDKVPYDVWIKKGYIKATAGNVIDYKVIMHDVGMIRETFDLRELAFDRWGATKLIQDIMEEGLTCVPFGQGFASMSPPTKELMNLLSQKKLHHGSHPVLRWMADNVMVKQDPSGNLKPDKSKSFARIDGIVAGIMSLDRAIRHGSGKPEKSVYEDRGIKTL